MTTSTKARNLPGLLEPEGDWRNVFSYHPMDVELARAEGIYLYDTEGRRYIDASGGPMAVNLGHNDRRMKAAMTAQLDDYAYVHPVLANRQRANLCNAVASVTPPALNATYVVSGGSEAVETAIKIARQYHVATGRHGKYKTVALHESYHGMTLATMALSGNPRTTQHFEPMLPKWPHIQQYSDYRRPEGVDRDTWAMTCAAELERTILYEGPETVAAFIATPHGCGPDYGVVPPAAYWREIRRICDAYDVLLIADEVITGFGRTGRWFGMDHFGVVPDMMVFGKGIGSCYAPLAAVTVSDRIDKPFKDGAYFVHGFTYGGHPLACAAGVKVIEILKADRLVENSAAMGARLHAQRDRLLAHPSVADVRGWGLFMVLELVETKSPRAYFAPERKAEQLLQSITLANGLVFYSTLYGPRRAPMMSRGLPMWVSPPLTITAPEVDDLVDRLDRSLGEWEDVLGVR
jgi:adenosylmethionine-8-amino-7-oxononanoate aminotransferase